jgi:hypothetical protein
MTTLILTSTEKQRDKILASMSEKTRTLAIEGGEKLKRLHSAGVLLFYELGERINDICTDETLDESTEVTKLAQYWGIDNTNKLYEMRNAALTFTKEFLVQQIREPLSNGQTLTFEHFKALRRVSSEKDRASLLKQTRKLGWTANELAAEIRGKGITTTKRTGGRNPAIPATVIQIVQKGYSQTQQLGRYLDAVAEPLVDHFNELPADKADDALVSKIDETVEQLEETRGRIDSFLSALTEGKTRVRSIIENTEAVSSDEDEGPVEDSFDDLMPLETLRERSAEDISAHTVADTSATKKRGKPRRSSKS